MLTTVQTRSVMVMELDYIIPMPKFAFVVCGDCINSWII